MRDRVMYEAAKESALCERSSWRDDVTLIRTEEASSDYDGLVLRSGRHREGKGKGEMMNVNVYWGFGSSRC
jgi:hypothetical protein